VQNTKNVLKVTHHLLFLSVLKSQEDSVIISIDLNSFALFKFGISGKSRFFLLHSGYKFFETITSYCEKKERIVRNE